jgi:C4-dicarboxylate-binding protein DctP
MYAKSINKISIFPLPMAQLLALGMFLLFTMTRAAHASDGPVTIRLSTQFRPQMASFQSISYFKSRVEEASQGRIHIEIHHSAELYSDVEVEPAVSSGAIEMGVADLSRYAETIPAADFFQLPFLFNNGELEKRAAAPGSEIRALIDNAILTQGGAKVLWWLPLGQTVFVSKGEALATPEKITGKAVRTGGPTANAIVTQCGGRAKDVSGEEVDKAFEAHEIDAVMSSISMVSGRQLWRYTDTVTRANHSSVQFVAVINDKFWQSLTAEDRTIIANAARAADVEARRVSSEVETGVYSGLVAGKGMKIVELSREELQLWRICSSDVLQQFLDKSGPPGEDLMHAYGRMQLETPPAEAPAARAAPAAASQGRAGRR